MLENLIVELLKEMNDSEMFWIVFKKIMVLKVDLK